MSRTDAEVTRAAERTARTVLRLLSERNTAEAERDMALEDVEVQYERANRVTDERDRARDLAAALEAQLAAVTRYATLTLDSISVERRGMAEDVLALLNPEQP